MESAQTEKGNRAKVANKANQQTPQGIVRRFLTELASHFDATWEAEFGGDLNRSF